MKTRRGVYLNIEDSDYCCHHEGITFYFSSPYYLERFTDLIEHEIPDFNKRANRIYKEKFELAMDKLGSIRLYQLIEKRGFRIKYKGREIHCLDHLTFELELKIKP